MIQGIADIIRTTIYILTEVLPMNEIAQFISTCGFPIACTIFLLFQSFRNDEADRKQYDELRKTIEGNTRALNALAKTVETLKKSFE